MEHVDPIQQHVDLKLGRHTYKLVFTFKALAVAEQELKKAGEPVNIFQALDFTSLSATSMVSLLYAALITHHPDIELETLPTFITMKRIVAIRQALFDAFVLSMVDTDEDAESDPLAQKPE